MIELDPKPLRKLYIAYHDRNRYMKLAAENERKVIEWRPATGEMIAPHPFKHKCFSPFKWLKKGQKAKVRQVDHGLDAEGRILIARGELRVACPSEQCFTETQYIYDGDEITAITAYPRCKPENFEIDSVQRFTYESGRLVRHGSFSWSFASIAVYHWKSGRTELSESCMAYHVKSFHPNRPEYRRWKGSDKVTRSRETYEYDGKGELVRWVWHGLNEAGKPDPQSKGTLLYLRPTPGCTIAEVSSEIEQLLAKQIPQVVAKAKIELEIYCLLVCYCGEDLGASLPPFLVLGSDKERQRILKVGSDVSYWLWAPDEMREKHDNFELSLPDKTLVEKCEMHRQLMSVKSNYSSVKKLLQNVAHKLNGHRWAKTLKTTPDFIVACVDNTWEIPFKKDIKASISAERFANLVKRKLL